MKKIKQFLRQRYISLIFLLSTIALLSALILKNKEIDTIKEQIIVKNDKVNFLENKEVLQDEFNQLVEDYDTLLGEYEEVSEELYEKDSIIQQQINEIKKLLKRKDFSDQDLSDAQDKIINLKEIALRYQERIVMLTDSITGLIVLQDSVIKENQSINWKNHKLNQENKQLVDKVNRGSVLEVIGVEVTPLGYRNTGREFSTTKAKKVQNLRVCFTVSANKISDAETKNVYMQLINPNGEVLRGAGYVELIVEDSLLLITEVSSFQYNNIETESCFEWERIEQLSKGKYILNLIVEDRVSAQHHFKLR